MKIAKYVELPNNNIVKGSTVKVVNNPTSNWDLIGRFYVFERTVGSTYTVTDIMKRCNNPEVETSVFLSNGYWYPESSLIFIK